MPVVFIHGVNTRKQDPDYETGRKQIGDFLRDILAPEVGWQAGQLQTFFPYWGDDGVEFRWNRASLPGPEEVESLALGSPDARLEFWLRAARREERRPAGEPGAGQPRQVVRPCRRTGVGHRRRGGAG